MLVLEAIGFEPLPAQTLKSNAIPPPVRRVPGPATLSLDEGLSVVAAARHLTSLPRPEGDCSHLVHMAYDRAGFPYRYASSFELYGGIESFKRVSRPQPGDLIVWQGHAGIVISPGRRLFFSALSHGPGTNRYDAGYWKRRGPPHFFRYIKRTDL